MTIAVDMEIRISLLQAVQAVLFFSLLIAVSAWDLRYRIIPDRFQAGIALLSFLNFAPRQLFGALGAVPYLIVALFCKREGGMGGGDIKLMFGAGFFLGAKPDCFLFRTDRICDVWLYGLPVESVQGKTR